MPTPEEIAQQMDNKIRIVFIIQQPYDLDFDDLQFLVDTAIKYNPQTIILSADDIETGLETVQRPPTEDPLDDYQDEFGRRPPMKTTMVLYTGEGTKEEIVRAFIRTY